MPTLTLRISPAEMAEVRRRARAAGTNVSAFVRRAVLPEAAAAAKPRVVRDKATGGLVLRHPPGTPPLRSEHVRTFLADFP